MKMTAMLAAIAVSAAAFASVEELSLYGSSVKDFSPLATCPKLANVTLTKGAFLPEGVRALEEALRANNIRAMVVER